MTRRNPFIDNVKLAYDGSANGLVTLVSGVPNIRLNLRELAIVTVGAGSALFSSNGVPIKSLAAGAGSSQDFGLDYELGLGSGLEVTTSVAMEVTAFYVTVDNTPGITKEASRTASYQASLLFPRAIRTPNRFGTQTEG